MEDVAAVPVLEGAGESISWTWIDPDAAVLVQGAELVVGDATSVLLRANAPKVEKDGETLAEGVVAAEAEAVEELDPLAAVSALRSTTSTSKAPAVGFAWEAEGSCVGDTEVASTEGEDVDAEADAVEGTEDVGTAFIAAAVTGTVSCAVDALETSVDEGAAGILELSSPEDVRFATGAIASAGLKTKVTLCAEP